MCKVCDRQARVRRTILRALGSGLTTSDQLAGQLGVSARTVYRYIAELRRDGHPIASGSGMGYILRRRPPSREGRRHG